MTPKKIPYQADGLAMAGDFYVDESKPGKRPGVLVFPERSGSARMRANAPNVLRHSAMRRLPATCMARRR